MDSQQGPNCVAQGMLLNVIGSLDGRGVWGEWIHVYACWAPLLLTWNYHNIINPAIVQYTGKDPNAG